ncbi:nucleotide pyrophosphohydrolase [Pediococcus inopinatus]|uniref:Nucleotide pyrophosphohydrolase n=1 Tax=Pediococcus inopinatus TaxID=114090 RepID=A0ABZ0Q4L6_9LACO|nr:nucleotide pyrophosphohydrolase [Pediococcus inopinatus]WPC20221.1 nucleotide pyrophosphohydrolase [Pediococcus inopinatus]WPC21926.1 nucleotide pyrophosphohydrolase [Pediococcus inopinatus]WPP09143.1 nucleotide pyrophosphohydrolase [Pediococcus inopinatus]
MDYEQIHKEIINFRDDRGWKKYHNLKDLALSLNLEASEVLEIFQWKKTDHKLSDEEQKHLEDELADTLIYAFYMCDKLGVNPYDIIQSKLNVNNNRKWNFDD